VDARRTDGARTSCGKAPIAAQCANASSQLLVDFVEKGGSCDAEISVIQSV